MEHFQDSGILLLFLDSLLNPSLFLRYVGFFNELCNSCQVTGTPVIDMAAARSATTQLSYYSYFYRLLSRDAHIWADSAHVL